MNPHNLRDAVNSRLAQRWPLRYRIQFACFDFTGEGMTLDLSSGGLCIVTNREIAAGREMYARLVLPDNTYLDVQTATVKWCDNGKVGLEIREMEQPEAVRLLELLSLFGGSAITYCRKYGPGPITIGSGRELGRYVAEALEAFSQATV